MTSIIIVNYNVTAELDNCLNSIFNNLDKNEIEVIVIDNNSTDRSVENLQLKYKEVNFRFLNENLGYGKANNLGIDISKGEYILLLNPDTILTENFIKPIIEFISDNHIAGACAPMLVYNDNSFQNSFGNRMGIFYEAAEALMFIKLYRKLFIKFKNKSIKKGKIFKVGWLSGACILIKNNVIKKAGGFDPDYFLNYEDIDLCRKIEELGYSNYYFPEYKCVHLDQSSQKKNYANLVLSRYKSRLIYSRKHYSFIKRAIIYFIHLYGLFIRILVTGLIYKNNEKTQRLEGYRNSLKLYLNFNI